MRMISVKAREGRVAYTDASSTKRISNTEYEDVLYTPYIDRLINHHKDLLVKKDEPKSSAKPDDKTVKA